MKINKDKSRSQWKELLFFSVSPEGLSSGSGSAVVLSKRTQVSCWGWLSGPEAFWGCLWNERVNHSCGNVQIIHILKVLTHILVIPFIKSNINFIQYIVCLAFNSRYIPFFIILFIYFIGCFTKAKEQKTVPISGWLLLGPSAFYYWSVAKQCQTFVAWMIWKY